jgi:hypothetical protein
MVVYGKGVVVVVIVLLVVGREVLELFVATLLSSARAMVSMIVRADGSYLPFLYVVWDEACDLKEKDGRWEIRDGRRSGGVVTLSRGKVPTVKLKFGEPLSRPPVTSVCITDYSLAFLDFNSSSGWLTKNLKHCGSSAELRLSDSNEVPLINFFAGIWSKGTQFSKGQNRSEHHQSTLNLPLNACRSRCKGSWDKKRSSQGRASYSGLS